jgi:transcriptional regulator with XRE-family HTH domain
MGKNISFNQELFSVRLKELLDENSMSTRELAKKLDFDHSTITRYANGETKPKMPTVESIAKVFSVNENWLKGTDDNKYAKPKAITDEELKFALFGGDVTDEKLNEVKKFAEYIKTKE